MDTIDKPDARALLRGQWVFDVVTVLLLVGIATPDVIHSGRPAAVPLSFGLLLPLVVRRWQPRLVLVIVAAVALLQWGIGIKLVADLALLVALYTVAAMSARRDLLVGIAGVEAGCVMAVLRWQPEPGVVISLVLLSGMTAAAAALGLYTGTRRAYLLSLQDRADRMELERDQQGALAAAAERRRIARELHDIVAHHLTVMVAVSDGAVATAASSPATSVEAMRTVSSVGREALRDTRRLLGVLRDATPEPAVDALAPLPDLSSLDGLVEQVRSTGLDVVLSIEGEPSELPTGLPLTVYRLVQEALTNTMKHADEPTRARVWLRHLPDSIVVEVSDDGLPTFAWEAGHGVTGMRERVLAWGGELTAGPLAPQGWRIQATLPREPTVVHMGAS